MTNRRSQILLSIVLGLLSTYTPTARADKKPEKLYFSGRLIEVDAAKHTFVIRSRNKELVFAVDVGRCNITVNGSISERSLRFARVGDAVLGKLSLREANPFVRWVEFTRQPQEGKAVAGKPGYILSPYLPRWPQPGYRSEAMDARQLKSGDMVLDDVSGKIFLVP